jgi:tetratricopeptide (TPR) repeat protein
VVEAERYAAQAFDAYSRKDYERALELYEAALAAAKSADILYNLARVHDVGLHEATLAIEYYRRYLAEPKAQPRAVSSPNGASPSCKRPSCQRPSRRRRSRTHRARPRRRRSLPTTRPRQRRSPLCSPPPAGPGARPPPRRSRAAGSSRSVWASVLVSRRIRAGDDWRHDCDGNNCTSQQGVDAARSAARSARVATVALAAGGALLAGGAAVWWFGSKREESSSQVALGLAPTSAGAEVGCSLAGTF